MRASSQNGLKQSSLGLRRHVSPVLTLAVETLDEAGLKAVIAKEAVNDPRVRKGAVVAQDPASGNLTRGGTVTLTISKGPKFVQVPDVFGKTEDAAREALGAAGFQVKVTYTFGAPVLGLVARQDKKDLQPEGSLITITVS